MALMIQDTTLREGQQTAFVSFTRREKLELAGMLSDFGVDFIDMMPVANRTELEINRELNNMGLRPSIVSLCRTLRGDIDKALEADAKWAGIFQGTSPILLASKLRVDEEKSLDMIRDSVSYARELGLKVRFGLEDASRTPYGYLRDTCLAAKEAGACRLTLADTLGTMRPGRMKELVAKIIAEAGLPVDVHCHNDLGLALANSLAAYEAGASCVHTTINGCGERVGIVRLAELVMALEILYGEKLPVKKEMLVALSEKFSEFSGIPTCPFMPVVGKNAFRHKSGIHTSALLRDKTAYELFEPESVGNRRSYILGGYTGKALLKHLTDKLQMGLGEEELKRELEKIKQKGGDLFEFSD
jgi:isopropylmalate/homocitrate/citramalate synthase